jgi:hypothetical protein
MLGLHSFFLLLMATRYFPSSVVKVDFKGYLPLVKRTLGPPGLDLHRFTWRVRNSLAMLQLRNEMGMPKA